MRKLFILLLTCLCIQNLLASTNTESDYTEALLAYQSGKTNDALGMVSTVLKQSPSHVKAWELKGLLLRDLGQTEQSLAIFLKLHEMAVSRKLSSKEIAAYAFQTGLLLHETKQFEKAKNYLSASLKEGFNTSACEYFLGLISLAQSESEKAETYFRRVTHAPQLFLSASAFYYLGVLAKNRDDSRMAVWNWKESKRVAQLAISPTGNDANSKSAMGLIEQADRAMQERSDSPPGYGHLSLITGYDSNVLLNPLIDVGASGASTALETVRYSVGLPVLVGDGLVATSWRGSANYNFHPDAHGGQFFTNDISILYSYRPKSPVSWGLRSGLLFIMRNDTAQSPTGALKKQSLGVPIAPFLTLSSSQTRWSNEFTITPQTFYTDDAQSTTYRKSGIDWRYHSELQHRTGNRFFSPGATIEIYRQQTSGEEYRMSGFSFGFFNRFAFSQTHGINLHGAIAYNTYGDRVSGARYDTQLSAGAEWDFQIWDGLFGTLELSYLDNLSNVASIYRYRRFAAGAGLDYRF